MGGDAPAECALPAAGFSVTEKKRRAHLHLRRSRSRFFLMTFLHPGVFLSSFLFFIPFNGGGARDLVRKPTEET